MEKKQKLLLEYLISSPDTFALTKSIVKPSYFVPELRNAAQFVIDYYDRYNSVPTPEQVEAEADVKLGIQTVDRHQLEYCTNEIEAFCRQRAIEQAIVASTGLLKTKDYGKIEQMIKDAVLVSLNRDLGTVYFDTPEERLQAMLDSPVKIPTKWREFDDALFGGLSRKEMIIFSANSGGGKSITLANVAVALLEQKLNVLYITLELSERIVAQRFDTMFTGVKSMNWQQHVGEIVSTLNNLRHDSGHLTIKYMNSGATSNDIRAYLKEYELRFGHVPDLLIVDYLDIMGTNQYVPPQEMFVKDKMASEEYRNILNDYNMAGATASQQNREAIKASEITQAHIAGGISKINTTDVHASILFTDGMKHTGEIGFQFIKTRNSDGVGKVVYLNWDNDHLRIRDRERSKDSTSLSQLIPNKSGSGIGVERKRTLTDLMDFEED